MKLGKTILLLMILINLVAIGFTSQCGTTCGTNFDNGVVRFFFDVDESNLMQVQAANVNSTLEQNVGDALTPQSAGATTGDISLLLDGLKMILGFLAILTPFPFLTLLYSLGIPFMVLMFFTVPIFAMYIISVIEFIRGGEF